METLVGHKIGKVVIDQKRHTRVASSVPGRNQKLLKEAEDVKEKTQNNGLRIYR